MRASEGIGGGDRVRRDGTGSVYVVEHIDPEFGLAHLREEGAGRMDCAYLSDLSRVSGPGVARARDPSAEPLAEANGGVVLRGAEIRKVAVRVLRSEPGERRAIHYRRWLELLKRSGYAIEGEREEVAFLSQLKLSPVVRPTEVAGVYEIDRGAPAELRAKLGRCRSRLARAGAAPPSAEARRIRRELLGAQERAERELEEALEVLGVRSEPGATGSGA